MNSTEHGRLSLNLNLRFSLNFPDGEMGTRITNCASLGEFLCAKFEISIQIHEVTMQGFMEMAIISITTTSVHHMLNFGRKCNFNYLNRFNFSVDCHPGTLFSVAYRHIVRFCLPTYVPYSIVKNLCYILVENLFYN